MFEKKCKCELDTLNLNLKISLHYHCYMELQTISQYKGQVFLKVLLRRIRTHVYTYIQYIDRWINILYISYKGIQDSSLDYKKNGL